MQLTDEQLLAKAWFSFPADRFEFVTAMMKNQEMATKSGWHHGRGPGADGPRNQIDSVRRVSPGAVVSLEPVVRGNGTDRETSQNRQAILTSFSAASWPSRSAVTSTTGLVRV